MHQTPAELCLSLSAQRGRQNQYQLSAGGMRSPLRSAPHHLAVDFPDTNMLELVSTGFSPYLIHSPQR
jgi:hypothetical protein